MKSFFSGRRKWRRRAAIALAAFVSFGVAGALTLPGIVKRYVLNELAVRIHRSVQVGEISVNPYALSLTLGGVEIGEREDAPPGVFFKADRIYANLESSSLFLKGLVIDEIRLEKPTLRLVREDDGKCVVPPTVKGAPPSSGKAACEGHYNFSDLAALSAQSKSGPQPEKGEHRALRFSLNNIQVFGGAIHFEDRSRQSSATLDEIELALPFLSSMGYDASGIFVKPSFSARLDGAPMTSRGRGQMKGGFMETELDVALNDIDLTKYLGWLPPNFPARVTEGRLGGQARVRFSEDDSKLFVAGQLSLKQLKLTEKNGAPLFSVDRFDVSARSIDWSNRTFLIDRIAADAPRLSARADSIAAWRAFFAPSGKTARPAAWSIETIDLTKGALKWEGRWRQKPYHLSLTPVSLKLSAIDYRQSSPIKFDLKLGLSCALVKCARQAVKTNNSLSLAGNIDPAAARAELTVNADGIDLAAIAPFIPENAAMEVGDGQMGANGSVRLWRGGAVPDRVNWAFAGDFSAQEVRARSDAGRIRAIRIKRVAFTRADIGPDRFFVDEIGIADFFVQGTAAPRGGAVPSGAARQDADDDSDREENQPVAGAVSSGGETPLQGEEALARGQARSAKTVFPVRIGRIVFQKGNALFHDTTVKPPYTARLREMSGVIEGISSEPGARASANVRGRYDNIAPFAASGRFNPFSPADDTEFKGEINGVEMPPLSGYARKHLGYPITKGKLSWTGAYTVKNRRLTAENQIFMDQLAFGGVAEEAGAPSVPAPLFVALMKDRSGGLAMDLPVSGSLDDLSFSAGSLVFEAFMKLMIKTVASPFSLLASMFDGSEEASMLEFDYGQSGILPATRDELDRLFNVLYERPELKIDLRGRADPNGDIDGLKKALVDQKIRLAKRKKLNLAGNAASIEIIPSEYPALAEAVYREERLQNAGTARVSVDEMLRQLKDGTPVGDDELSALADRRARAARDYLVARGVAAERVFLLSSRIGRRAGQRETPDAHPQETADSQRKATRNRVDVILK